MEFDTEQSMYINNFIMKYYSDGDFKSEKEREYDFEMDKLSILDIYALEIALRYGNKKIYEAFKKAQDVTPEIQFEDFMKQLYAEFNPICCSNEQQIIDTIENLFIGEFIHEMLNMPIMRPIKERQGRPGQVSSMDKPYIIKEIQEMLLQNCVTIAQFKQAVAQRVIEVKKDRSPKKRMMTLEPYLEFNTNISASEVLGEFKINDPKEIQQILDDMARKMQQDDELKR